MSYGGGIFLAPAVETEWPFGHNAKRAPQTRDKKTHRDHPVGLQTRRPEVNQRMDLNSRKTDLVRVKHRQAIPLRVHEADAGLSRSACAGGNHHPLRTRQSARNTKIPRTKETATDVAKVSGGGGDVRHRAELGLIWVYILHAVFH